MASLGQPSLEDFTRSIVLLVRRIRVEAPAAMHSLSWTQRSVLARLETDGPTSSAGLARAEGITLQSMSTAIASLEELGFVERKPDPADGRQLLVAVNSMISG